jgi:hypothetical protein
LNGISGQGDAARKPNAAFGVLGLRQSRKFHFTYFSS